MLLKTTAEVKTLLPRLLAKLNNNALLPNFDRVEQKYLLPLIGKPLYDRFVTTYNAGNAAGDDIIILKNMQLVAASYGFLDELALNVATITDAGINSSQTTNMPRIYGWEFKAFKSALQDAAADAVDVLLQSLWQNKETLNEWTADDSYKQFNGLLIKTAFEFNQCHTLFQPQRTFYAIKSCIQDVQDQYLATSLGDDLVNYFISTAALTDGEKKCLAYMQRSIAFYAIKRACEHYATRMSDAGFTVVATGDPENADSAGRTGEQVKSDGFLIMKMQACDRDGQAYMAKAKKELVKYYSDPGASVEFKTAFETSKLVGWVPKSVQDKKNCHRKLYRF